ncbi:MAG: hypothetical protein FWF84_05920 [Kiritimatiellaeota bacterium]|nr:hypothetical protein [Kiritimatiellota bacterium]
MTRVSPAVMSPYAAVTRAWSGMNVTPAVALRNFSPVAKVASVPPGFVRTERAPERGVQRNSPGVASGMTLALAVSKPSGWWKWAFSLTVKTGRYIVQVGERGGSLPSTRQGSRQWATPTLAFCGSKPGAPPLLKMGDRIRGAAPRERGG